MTISTEEIRKTITERGLDCVSDVEGLELLARLERAEKERDALRAKIAVMERQEPGEQDTSVRKAWARFSHKLHRSPDATYPGMADAFEQHFSQSFIDREWRAEAATWAAAWKAAKRHGAQPAPSIPVEAIGKMLADVMAVAVSNGANSVSMPDEYVEVAVWLQGECPKQPAPSVPDDWMQHAARMAALARKLREPDWHFESIREMQRELYALEEVALAAAPEAKT